MSNEVLLFEGEVVGGLWPGALYEDNTRKRRILQIDDIEMWRELVLPGPLGLGATGLAVRITERLGWSEEWVWGLSRHLVQYGHNFSQNVGLQQLAEDERGSTGIYVHHDKYRTWSCEVLARVSSYLSLTDRLRVLVDLEYNPTEVTSWRRVESDDDDIPTTWLLGNLRRGRGARFGPVGSGAGFEIPKLVGVDDPIKALRRCVGELQNR